MKQNNREFIFVNKRIEANDVTSLFFKTADGLPYEYKAGQYINVRPVSISGHGKSYTISSSPSEELLCLTVKRKGTVSSALIDLKVEEKIIFDGPYGFFYPEDYNNDIVMIASGIGITPFFSVIKDRVEKVKTSNMYLYYSNKKLEDITFFDELNKMCNDNQWLKIIYTLTQDKTKYLLIDEYQRLDKKLFKKYTSLSNKKYYICGSISFVNDMWKLLKSEGILEENIFTESFF